MRKATVNRRLRCSLLTDAQKQKVHKRMLGYSDHSTQLNREHNGIWTEAVRLAFIDYNEEDVIDP